MFLSFLLIVLRFFGFAKPQCPAQSYVVPDHVPDVHLEPVEGELLIDGSRFGYPGQIAVIEDKEFVADFHGISAKVGAVLARETDAVHMTLGHFSLRHPFERLHIYVWDLNHFMKHVMRDAVIAHEVGHVQHYALTGEPAGLEAEVAADKYACDLGFTVAMYTYLSSILNTFPEGNLVTYFAEVRKKAIEERLMRVAV